MILSAAVTADMLQALTRGIDSDPANLGALLIYSAPVPLAGQAPNAATLLARLTFPKPSAQSVTGGTLMLATPTAALAIASGDAAWVRITNGAGDFVADEDDVGVLASSARVKIDNGIPASSLTIYAGGSVSVTLARWALV